MLATHNQSFCFSMADILFLDPIVVNYRYLPHAYCSSLSDNLSSISV